jgi:hypothetical protein
MDAKYLREKAEMCLRLADGLSLNNPSDFNSCEWPKISGNARKNRKHKPHNNGSNPTCMRRNRPVLR